MVISNSVSRLSFTSIWVSVDEFVYWVGQCFYGPDFLGQPSAGIGSGNILLAMVVKDIKAKLFRAIILPS